MVKEMQPVVGPGRFQWNGIAWFGSILGSIAWLMPVAGFLLINGQPGVALVPSFAFSVAGLCSAVLWGRRDQLRPFQAFMIMLGVLAILFPAVFFIVLLTADEQLLTRLGWEATLDKVGIVCGIMPAVMLYSRFVEHKSLRRK